MQRNGILWLVAILVQGAAASLPRDPPTQMTTVTVPDALALGAVFPNGQPWQYQLNTTAGSTGWIIHMSGGGWEFMKNGSSALHVPDGLTHTQDDAGCYGICDGIMSNDIANNPEFASYNKVFILIGDRTSFTGDRWADDKARGKRGLDAVLADLAGRFGLGGATQVVLTGGSSGGLATYLVCDRVAEQLESFRTDRSKQLRYACLADAGFFMDHNTTSGEQSTTPLFRESFYAWNSSAGTNQACIAHHQPQGEEWKCIMAQYVLPFIQSRLFVMQNLYDSWQLANILRLRCSSYNRDLSQCGSSDMAHLQSYGATMRTLLAPVLGDGKHGMYAVSCIAHCQSTENEHSEALWHWPARWGVNSTTASLTDDAMLWPRETFGDWFFGRPSEAASGVMETCDWGPSCNPLCPLFT